MSHPWIGDRKRVCMNKHLQPTIDNLAKFNARRRLKGAVIDAFANKLSYYHGQPGSGHRKGFENRPDV
jgi:calcium/calmodulin-dependent serine protein kinase